MARIGDSINPGLLQYDPSPFLRAQGNATASIGRGLEGLVDKFSAKLDQKKEDRDAIRTGKEVSKALAKIDPELESKLGDYLNVLDDGEIPESQRAMMARQAPSIVEAWLDTKARDRGYQLQERGVNMAEQAQNFDMARQGAQWEREEQTRQDNSALQEMVAPGLLENTWQSAKQSGAKLPFTDDQIQGFMQEGTPAQKMQIASLIESYLPQAAKPEFRDIPITIDGQPGTATAMFNPQTGSFEIVPVNDGMVLPPKEADSFSAPVTHYSTGAAAGGPDELQDKWTNKGYSSTGKNLTEGMAAVNDKVHPLGTVFKDTKTGEVFIAGDRHGNPDPNVIDLYKDPANYTQSKGTRNLQVVGREATVGNSPQAVQAQLDKYRGSGVRAGAVKGASAPKTQAELQKEQLEIEKLQGDVAAKKSDEEKQKDMKATAIASAKDTLADIERLMGKKEDKSDRHPGFQEAVGAGFYRGVGSIPGIPDDWTPAGTDKAGAMSIINKIKASAFLNSIQQLRGLGALSDAEGKKLEAAAANLDPNQGEADFEKSISQFKEYLDSAIQRLDGEQAKSSAIKTATEAIRGRRQ